MKIACVTPFYANSAVGEVAERAAIEMVRSGHDVELIGTGPKPFRSTALPLVAAGEFGRLTARDVAAYDAIVYHVPNDPAAAPLFWLLERVPGTVVLHDRTYVHAYDGYTKDFLGDAARLEATAKQFYGDEGVAFVRRFRAWQSVPDDFYRFSFLEPIVDNALGVVVHDQALAIPVRARGVPVSVSQPSYDAAGPFKARHRAGNHPLSLTYLGHVSPYRCLPVLFEVLRDRQDLRALTKLTIVGKVDDEAFVQSLRSIVSDFGIGDSIKWALNATEDEKVRLLESSDAAFNCRTLNSEGFSASLVEEMANGLPVIVNRGGFALEVPEESVLFVGNETMRGDVEHALERLIKDPALGARVGAAARAWAESAGSMTTYAGAIVDAARARPSLRGLLQVRGTLRSANERTGGMSGDDVERMAMLRVGALFEK